MFCFLGFGGCEWDGLGWCCEFRGGDFLEWFSRVVVSGLSHERLDSDRLGNGLWVGLRVFFHSAGGIEV